MLGREIFFAGMLSQWISGSEIVGDVATINPLICRSADPLFFVTSLSSSQAIDRIY